MAGRERNDLNIDARKIAFLFHLFIILDQHDGALGGNTNGMGLGSLPVTTWVLSSFSGFLLQSKKMYVRQIGNYRLVSES